MSLRLGATAEIKPALNIFSATLGQQKKDVNTITL